MVSSRRYTEPRPSSGVCAHARWWGGGRGSLDTLTLTTRLCRRHSETLRWAPTVGGARWTGVLLARQV